MTNQETSLVLHSGNMICDMKGKEAMIYNFTIKDKLSAHEL